MALKKSQLYLSLWQSCDELRGGMDASQYKDYVLTLLFMKYVSDKYAGSPDALIEVPAGGGFADMVKLKGDNSRMVPVAEIAGPANEYNLNIPRYVDSSEPEDQHDLGAHLNGGIPDRDLDALDTYWTVFPSLRPTLFEANGRPGYSDARVGTQQVKATILKKYKMDLIPPALIVARWFAAEQAAIDKLQGAQETAARELEEFVEEHSSSGGGEDGLLADAANDRGRVTSAAVKQRLKTIRGEPENDEERAILMRCLALIEAESQAGKAVKEAQAALDRAVLARYATLTAAEIKTLVVEDKWYASIRAAIDDEVQRLTQRLTRRVQELEQRYARPLPALEQEVEVFSAKVERHLKRMGVPQRARRSISSISSGCAGAPTRRHSARRRGRWTGIW